MCFFLPACEVQHSSYLDIRIFKHFLHILVTQIKTEQTITSQPFITKWLPTDENVTVHNLHTPKLCPTLRTQMCVMNPALRQFRYTCTPWFLTINNIWRARNFANAEAKTIFMSVQDVYWLSLWLYVLIDLLV